MNKFSSVCMVIWIEVELKVSTSRPAIAGNPSCKNTSITAKSVHLTSLYHMALTSTNDHLSVLRHYVCT